MGIRSAAQALDLDFITVGWERYDLVIPQEHLPHPGVAHLLALLVDEDFKRELGMQPGYDARAMGVVQHDS